MKNIVALYLFFSLIPLLTAQAEPRPLKTCQISKSPRQQHAPETAFCNDCIYWQNGIVPYEFDPNVQAWQQTAMLDAMAVWESVANVDFVPRNGQSDYLKIRDANENSSQVGKQGGGQTVNIYNWNYPMVMCHELAHALGFYHEQSRPDRDNYVRINQGNICPGQEHNFDIDDTGVTPNIPYDFNSIMHYGKFGFARCQNPNENCNDGCSSGYVGPTIEILPAFDNGQNNIGQRIQLSRSDSLMMSFVYPYAHYRFVNGSYLGTFPYGQYLYAPLLHFTVSWMDSSYVPEMATVWIMPGEYTIAEGTYTKPMTVRAPFGGVVLK